MVAGKVMDSGSIALTAHTRHDAEQLRAVGGVDIILEPFSAAAHATSDTLHELLTVDDAEPGEQKP